MSDAKLELKIPDEMIQQLVKGEIVKALGNQTELIEGIVSACLNQPYKDRNGYTSSTKETIFMRAFQEMVEGLSQYHIKLNFSWSDR